MKSFEAYYEFLEYLKANQPFPVFDGENSDDDDIPAVDGVISPHYFVWLQSAETSRARRHRDLGTPEGYPEYVAVIVDGIGHDWPTSQRLRAKAQDLMVGWRTEGVSHATAVASHGYSEVQTDLKPTIYHSQTMFRFLANL